MMHPPARTLIFRDRARFTAAKRAGADGRGHAKLNQHEYGKDDNEQVSGRAFLTHFPIPVPGFHIYLDCKKRSS
jgi:hypothetical protein